MPKAYTPNDKFFYKAKKLWYRARSAFKLLEIQEKFKILQKWDKILDLWCFPGSWMQVSKEILWENWEIIWVDLKKIDKMKWVKTFQCDVFWDELWKLFYENNLKNFDVILSDMAPNTSWIFDVDQYKSVLLNLEALKIMKSYLKIWGFWVFKIFRWEDIWDFLNEAKKIFPGMKTFKPKSCRDRSFEIFCIWKRLK
jgi:23S rRNA (uridine2552-2'-O)-methyltransferase